MYCNEMNVHKVGPSMTPRERLMTPLGVMTHSLGTTDLGRSDTEADFVFVTPFSIG